MTNFGPNSLVIGDNIYAWIGVDSVEDKYAVVIVYTNAGNEFSNHTKYLSSEGYRATVIDALYRTKNITSWLRAAGGELIIFSPVVTEIEGAQVINLDDMHSKSLVQNLFGA